MKKLFLILSVILLTACQDLNDPSNYINKQVQDFTNKYLAALNNNDRQTFQALLSPQFSQPLEHYLERRFTAVNEYTKYQIVDIQQVDQTIVAKIDFKKQAIYDNSKIVGSSTLKGWVLEKRELIFNRQKQLLSDKIISIQEKYDQANLSPKIHEFYPDTLTAKPGDSLRYYFTIQKRQKFSVLKILFNGQVIVGELLDSLVYNNHHTITIPYDSNDLFSVELIAVEGNYDNSDPSKLRDINLAVRKLIIPVSN